MNTAWKILRKKMENQQGRMDVDQGVIITFDDGIKDNIEAAEILEAEGSSGIFFLASMPYTWKISRCAYDSFNSLSGKYGYSVQEIFRIDSTKATYRGAIL